MYIVSHLVFSDRRWAVVVTTLSGEVLLLLLAVKALKVSHQHRLHCRISSTGNSLFQAILYKYFRTLYYLYYLQSQHRSHTYSNRAEWDFVKIELKLYVSK